MRLTVGEISKVLDLSGENIRYYVREGLIHPEKNTENNYWEYSSEDLLLITDILFYRDLGLSINSIHKIFDGLPLEDIGSVIETTKDEINAKIVEYTAMYQKLQSWDNRYKQGMYEMGKFSIGLMPASFRISRYYDQSEHIANYLKNNICVHKNDLQRLSISFMYDFKKEPDKINQYISLEKNERTTERNKDYNLIIEEEKLCLTTHAIYIDDVPKMVEPLIKYASENNIELTGEIYGRERTNFYIDRKRHWVCSIYAPIVQNDIRSNDK